MYRERQYTSSGVLQLHVTSRGNGGGRSAAKLLGEKLGEMRPEHDKQLGTAQVTINQSHGQQGRPNTHNAHSVASAGRLRGHIIHSLCISSSQDDSMSGCCVLAEVLLWRRPQHFGAVDALQSGYGYGWFICPQPCFQSKIY
jgi:hypothetical protein